MVGAELENLESFPFIFLCRFLLGFFWEAGGLPPTGVSKGPPLLNSAFKKVNLLIA
jgi:hypothetical protein